jgi:hypothetical protein
MNTASRFQLFSIITKYIRSFLDGKVKNILTSIEKELQQTKTDNTALTCYINTKRKKEARKKAEESESSKGLFPPAS